MTLALLHWSADVHNKVVLGELHARRALREHEGYWGQAVIAHMASSSSGFRDGQQYHLDLVRLGTALYSFDKEGSAARWLTRITGIKQARSPDDPTQLVPCSCT